MTTVWELASEAEEGDWIKWVGEDADVDNPRASTVTRSIREESKITIEADGPNGATVSFWVEQDGTSKVRGRCSSCGTARVYRGR